MGFIYKITSPSGKLYVGKTYSIKKRIGDYRCLRYRSKKSIIMDSIRKYGWDAHVFEIIEEIADELMNEREMFWIKEFKTYAYEHENGMNLTKGADGQRHSWKHDIERVEKARARGGKNSYNYGKPVPDKVRDKISKSVAKYHKHNENKPTRQCRIASVKATSNPVVCYDLSGKLLGMFPSIAFAARYFNIPKRTANDAYLGRQKHAHSVIFKQKTFNYPMNIDVPEKIFVRKNCLTTNIKNASEKMRGL